MPRIPTEGSKHESGDTPSALPAPKVQTLRIPTEGLNPQRLTPSAHVSAGGLSGSFAFCSVVIPLLPESLYTQAESGITTESD